MKQASLIFDDSPRARCTDPPSSHRAADESAPRLPGQRGAVLEALRLHPGRSSKDLAAVANLDRHMVARRLPELLERGLVDRVCRGSDDALWFPAATP